MTNDTTNEPRYLVATAQPNGTLSVEDRATGDLIATFHATGLLDVRRVAYDMADELNFKHEAQEAAKQRRSDLRRLVDAMTDDQVQRAFEDLKRQVGIDGIWLQLFGGRQ